MFISSDDCTNQISSQIKTEVITQYSLTISNSTYLIMNYLAFLKSFFRYYLNLFSGYMVIILL